MRSAGVIVGLVLALGGGFFAFQRSITSGPVQVPPQEQIDVVGIRQTLLAMGQAERQYLVAHGTYATLDQLSTEGLLPGGASQRGYVFTAAVAGADGFIITATPADASKASWPTLTVSESMEVRERQP